MFPGVEATDHGGIPYFIPLTALSPKWEFPKLRGTILGVVVFWGLYWGPPILGNYQILSNRCILGGGVPGEYEASEFK